MTGLRRTAPARRLLGAGDTYAPCPYQVGPDIWVVAYYALTPKQGDFWRAEFPHFWGRNETGRDNIWRVAADGDVPDVAYRFTDRGHAERTLATVYPPGEPFRPNWVEVPSRDQRRRRVAPRQTAVASYEQLELTGHAE